jgi:hypothetical protein
MKKINYFNREIKDGVDFTKDNNEDIFVIKPLSIEVEDDDLDHYLDIINKSYGKYGEVKIIEDLENIKQSKILEISYICEDKIVNEFYSSCLGEKKKIDCTRDDQSYIMGLVAKSQMIASGIATDKTLDWKASGEPICYPWTPQQVIALGMDLFNHLTEKKKRYEGLRMYIDQLTDIETIKAITWDTEIPTA